MADKGGLDPDDPFGIFEQDDERRRRSSAMRASESPMLVKRRAREAKEAAAAASAAASKAAQEERFKKRASAAPSITLNDNAFGGASAAGDEDVFHTPTDVAAPIGKENSRVSIVEPEASEIGSAATVVPPKPSRVRDSRIRSKFQSMIGGGKADDVRGLSDVEAGRNATDDDGGDASDSGLMRKITRKKPTKVAPGPNEPKKRRDRTLQRQQTLVRPERKQVMPDDLLTTELAAEEEDSTHIWWARWWNVLVWLFTWPFLPIFLSKCGKMKDKNTQFAWREKFTLVSIIFLCCAVLAFFTFAFQQVACGLSERVRLKREDLIQLPANTAEFRGQIWEIPESNHPFIEAIPPATDASRMLVPDMTACRGTGFDNYPWPCVVDSLEGTAAGRPFCHITAHLTNANLKAEVYYTWEDVEQSDRLVVYNGMVLDTGLILDDPLLSTRNFTITALLQEFLDTPAGDATMFMAQSPQTGQCLTDLTAVGFVDTKTIGCLAADIVLVVSLAFILGLVMLRFILAVYFSWFMSKALGRLRFRKRINKKKKGKKAEVWGQKMKTQKRKGHASLMPSSKSAEIKEWDSWRSGVKRSMNSGLLGADMVSNSDVTQSRSMQSIAETHKEGDSSDDDTKSVASSEIIAVNDPRVRTIDPLYTVLLVTCYSEDRDGIKITLDSLANTDFPDKYKLIFAIADGMITGAGQDMSTPEALLSTLTRIDDEEPEPMDYVAVAEGSKAHNMAKVYPGYYDSVDAEGNSHHVPMVVIIKCGTEKERQGAKPGNRGKRDGQVMLMDFFSKVLLDDPLSPLQFDLFRKIYAISGASADKYEIVLMVDADTKVMKDSLTRMVLCMARDPEIMGLCGETRIANKNASWVSAIQVFEYHISHHLSKAFESIFGGVTCLPGCFCMYRIKTPKRGFWALILANPYIIKQYSVSQVDTLHRKNLLLLGEDRFLTTLMLRTFPSRKMMFVPKAVCKTFVPDSLKVLLSQRRRWINSTVHNLMELVLVRELCGTFCFSMQFVVFIELFGTVTLPAAITFTFYLLLITFIGPQIPWIPLFLLFSILGLPAFMIMITSGRMIYVLWMLIYLMALPVWNFLLPVYAFWHFDDFSWGETRKVDGEGGDDHGSGAGDKAAAIAAVQVKPWLEWMNQVLKHHSHTKKFNEIVEKEETVDLKVAKIDPRLSKVKSNSSLASQALGKEGSKSSMSLFDRSRKSSK